MTPANQCFNAADLGAINVDLGLVDQKKLARGDGFAKLSTEHYEGPNFRLHRIGEVLQADGGLNGGNERNCGTWGGKLRLDCAGILRHVDSGKGHWFCLR